MKSTILRNMCLQVLCLMLCACAQKQAALSALQAGFADPPTEYRPWCYWWWQNGNVDRETICSDLETMKELGFGGLILVDARGYWDDDDHVRVLPPQMDFMSGEWIDAVCFALQKADSLGLKVTVNISSCAGSLKGPWLLGEDAPEQLVYQTFSLPAGQHAEMQLPEAALPYFKDVALFAVRYDGAPRQEQAEWRVAGDGTYTMSSSSGRRIDGGGDTPVASAIEVVELTSSVKEGHLSWDVPQGQWMLLRFGSTTIPGYEYDVDILDPGAVQRHFERIIQPFSERVGGMFGGTFANIYSVSWEGSVPTWSPCFEEDFKKFNGRDLRPLMPMLAGFEIGEEGSLERFMTGYRKARNDMFRENFYLTMRKLAHGCGLGMISESGGPWKRTPAVFREADQLEFLSVNDMPQGEFWCNGRSHLKGAVAAAHMYGLPKVSAEAFTYMGLHWSMYPFALKKFADLAYSDGANHLVWHTFSCTPERFGTPGPDYFAGTHLNRNVTWYSEAGPFIKYLSRCQYLLRQGLPVVDIAVWAGDRVYQHWGHYRDKPYDSSSLHLPEGYNSDIINTDVLLQRAKAKGGRIVLPDGMSYAALILDPEFPEALTEEVQRKIASLRKAGVPVFEGGDSLAMPFPADFEGAIDCAHRRAGNLDIYYVAGEGPLSLSFRSKGRAQVWDAVSGRIRDVESSVSEDGRSSLQLFLPENGSAFVVFDSSKPAATSRPDTPGNVPFSAEMVGPWEVSFRYHKLEAAPPAARIWEELRDLSLDSDPSVRHFSGTVSLENSLLLSEEQAAGMTTLSLGCVKGGLAHLYVNGEDCGTVWTAPWEADVSGRLKAGDNSLRIDFTNTWQNLLIGDCALPEGERLASTSLHYYDYPRRKAWWGWYPNLCAGYSAFDDLCPNGVLGPLTLH